MLASPEEMCCSAHANNRNGATHSSTATTVRCAHTTGADGSARRVMRHSSANVAAPATRRPRTTCPGESPSRPILMNRKLAPHARANSTYWTSTGTLEVLKGDIYPLSRYRTAEMRSYERDDGAGR